MMYQLICVPIRKLMSQVQKYCTNADCAESFRDATLQIEYLSKISALDTLVTTVFKIISLLELVLRIPLSRKTRLNSP